MSSIQEMEVDMDLGNESTDPTISDSTKREAINAKIGSSVLGQQMESESCVGSSGTTIVGQSVMASSCVSTPAISVSLHPLVIMNVSEHWTRIRAQENCAQQVIGALIGKQNGRNIEIMNSFELNFDRIENDIIIDRDYYNTKESQFKQVFPDLDFLGWYTSGDIPNESDLKIHKQIIEINESPLFLKLNPMVTLFFFNNYYIYYVLIMININNI
jgi:hypothetical protein